MRLFSRERHSARTAGSGEESVSDVLGVASDRIRGIVEAAERAAADISAKVRLSPEMQGGETSRISRERLVAEIAESLVARAEELSREAENLADVLERASSRLDVSPPRAEAEATVEKEPTGPTVTPPTFAQPVKPPKVAPSPQASGANLSRKVSERFQDAPASSAGAVSRFKRRPTSTKAPRPAPSRSTEGLRLLATQMAVAGSTHEEIASRLRDEFGVEDATALLGEAPIAPKVKESKSSG